MLEYLKKQVFEANIQLPKLGLVTHTWGNVSAIDRSSGHVIIKASGIPYENMKIKDLVVLDLNGCIIEGDLKPSVDTPTHLELYKNFHNIGSVIHTHSKWATIWAQSGFSIPAFGTTHADYFYGDIKCTRELTQNEINTLYEQNTGRVIVEELGNKDPLENPGILVQGHGPFCWGKDVSTAINNAQIIEMVANMAYHTIQLNPGVKPIPKFLLDKHYKRKHGTSAQLV